MPATVIAERVGWTRGITIFRAQVAELRPAYLPVDPASRTSYVAGEIAQCDFWFPPIELPVGFGQVRGPKLLPVRTMVTGYSRWLSAMLVPTRRAEDLLAGWWHQINALGAVPRTLVWDGEGVIGRNRGGRVELTQDCQAFRGVLGTRVIVLMPAEPEHKGIIERAHDYLERSFLPGRVFTGPSDFNAQLQGWLAPVNARRRRALGCAPNRSERRGPPSDAHPGTGKTHLATGIAIRACQAGHRVQFATASQWVARLAEAHHAGTLQQELIRLGRYPLLVIDEVGYIPFEPEAVNLFFQLVSSRYERASLIVTSNKPFGRWDEVFGDDVVAAAMIDRLVHHAEVVALKGDSYRLKDRDLGRVPGSTTEET